MFTANIIESCRLGLPEQSAGMPFAKNLEIVYAMDDGNDTLGVITHYSGDLIPILIRQIEIYL